ncbi:cytochrome-c oxidase, cbb3-type subunit III [Sansalvadorimonas verongulae]|uniref:cytochrome-c oxidase, cbb3-type subunit III n=1 Tax=Sansalvadorimonas verongulae TaxID=2172824 RepID=UPI0012BB75A2|nr:cytochrome-c oxidase, cbb3-type subunit III [Sansalvadorimonas verongulae]MTI12464.1 cytochrome-c oxidase, cbb3-type subunit III [Sansalvadorimonas verongulae]
MSDFWSAWVLILTLACLGFICFVLFSTWKVQRKDSTEETVGHEFDGITEYDNPMPMWWIGLFLATLIFGAVYFILYPGIWPGKFDGILGWSSTGELKADQQKHARQYQPLFEQYAAKSIEQLQENPKALSMGKRIFLNNCALCHGSDAGGAFGFPNLTDHDWVWGGVPAEIKASIMEGRNGQMPAWGPVLGESGVRNVASYIRDLSGLEVNATIEDLASGKAAYATTCAVCHGGDAQGNKLFGAPNLTDDIWLYGNSQAQVEYTIRKGRNGVMPAWKDILGPEKVHLVSAYVYSLSHKDKTAE